MTLLYSNLATVYHEMYQHIFDYDQEFNFYDRILSENNCRDILEIGCGTGMLARRFLTHGYEYLGLDLNTEMLNIARDEVMNGKFVQGDMRALSFHQQFDSVLITGRSIAYVLENQEIIDTLTGVYNALKDDGLFIVGFFEANEIFDNFDDFDQTIIHNNKKKFRTSHLKKNLKTGWTYDWYATYSIEEENGIAVYEDLSTLRAFTKDEISLFLKMTGFKIKEMIVEKKVFTIIAKKNAEVSNK